MEWKIMTDYNVFSSSHGEWGNVLTSGNTHTGDTANFLISTDVIPAGALNVGDIVEISFLAQFLTGYAYTPKVGLNSLTNYIFNNTSAATAECLYIQKKLSIISDTSVLCYDSTVSPQNGYSVNPPTTVTVASIAANGLSVYYGGQNGNALGVFTLHQTTGKIINRSAY